MEGKTAIIILAAGNSSRLGRPKQLLLYNGKTLLRHIIDEAVLFTANVVVVTGEENAQIAQETGSVYAVKNENWKQGMASSIKKGLQVALEKFPENEQFIFTVCDQPYLTVSVFKKLVDKRNSSEKGIVVSAYSDTLGTPVLFSSTYIKELFNLKGKKGARKLIEKFKNDTDSIPFEQGKYDIDTLEDYKKLLNT